MVCFVCHSIMTYVFISSIIYPVVLRNGYECKTQSDCDTPDTTYNVCSICADEKNSSNPKCKMIYKDFFDNVKNCYYMVTNPECLTRLKNCSGNGQCYSRFANFFDKQQVYNTALFPRCYCQRGHYGNFCEEKNNINETATISWLYICTSENRIHSMTVGQFLEQRFELASTNIEKTSIFFYGENGFYESHSASNFTGTQRAGTRREGMLRLLHVYKLPIRYPFKPITMNSSEIFTLKDNVLGYEGTLRLKVILEFVANDYPIKMFVSYNEKVVSLKCIAVIQLINCGDHADLPLNMTAEDHIEIQRRVDYYDDGKFVSKTKLKPECVNEALTSWKIWKMGKKYRESYEHLYHLFLPEIFDNKTLYFPPYTFQPARYKFLNEVWSILVEGKSINFAYCHIVIRQIPLSGYVVGGSEKRAHKAYGLEIEVKAEDRNWPKEQRGDLQYRWICKNFNDSNDPLCTRPLNSSTSTCNILQNQLMPGSVYIFTSTIISRHNYEDCDDCKNVLSLDLDVMVTVASDREPPPESKYVINIKCLLNCGEKVVPHEIMVLEAQPVEKTELEYVWSYGKVGEGLKPTDDIAEDIPDTDTLSIKRDSLAPGTRYKIVASVVGKANVSAEYFFFTDSIDVESNDSKPMECRVTPEKGTKGFDLFEIDCGRYSSYRFEFYDKRTEDSYNNVIFNGRMLGTSFNGKLSNIRLTRDLVHIYVYNKNGMLYNRTAIVTLVARDYTIGVKNEIMHDLRTMTELGELSRLLGYISIVPDVISYNDVNDVKRIAKALISAFGKTPPVNLLADVKLFTSTLYNVLTSLNKLEPLELLPHRMLLITSTISQQAAGLNNAIFDKESSRWLASSEVQVIAKSLLDCLMAAIMSRDHKYDNLNEEEIDIYLLDIIKRSTNKVEDTIELLNEVLTYRQAPAQPPTSVASSDNNTILWVMINNKAFRIFDMLEIYDIPVRIPTRLQRVLEDRLRKSEQLNLQVAYMNQNIFWWCKSDVKSNLVSVTIASQYKERRMSQIESQDPSILISLELKDNLTEKFISGLVTQLDSNLNPLDLDLALTVHRLDPEPRSLIHLHFIFPQTTSQLKVFVSEDFRPDYATMKSKSFLISEQSPNYTLLDFISREKRTFLYMAILPGPEVKINESVNYTFEISTKVCQLWVQGYWTSQSCQITSNTTGNTIYCKCSHFSIFAAAFPVPPQEVDPFSDAKLFLTFFDNPLVVSVVLAMLVIFFLLLLILWFLDKRDKRLGHVIILNDNYPNDPFPYLVAVYTGSRFCSGTTANVAVTVLGKESSSRPHVFFSGDRKVLQRNADDWFVIFTPNQLGNLNSLHLWHDSAGYSPDWFCERIVIYDITQHEETAFIVEQWIALHLHELPQLIVFPARYVDIKDLKRTFLDNCILGLREGHLLMSIISRHPRSEITRVQRVSLLMTCIMVAMLCSIMFYRPQNAEIRVDDYEYSIGTRELLISIQSLILSLIITFTVLLLFRSSYKIIISETERDYTLMVQKNSLSWEDNLRSSQTEPVEERYARSSASTRRYSQRNAKGKTIYQNFVRIISKAMQTRVLTPVALPSSVPSVKKRPVFYVFAWVLCLTVILASAYFIMLYGLKLGAVNSQMWLSSVLLTVSEEVLITGPFRIMFIAVLLSIAYRKLYEANVHEVRFNEVIDLHPPNTEEYLFYLIERRSLRMYMPLIESYIQEMIRRLKIRHNWWTLMDFLIAFCFVFLLNSVIYRLWTSHYYCNENVKKLVADSHHPRLDSVDFNDISSITLAERYLEISFIQAVYSYRWYNGAPFKASYIEYWDLAATSRMFGLPLLRQLRALPFLCENLIELSGYCTPKWSVIAEETESYSTGWLPASWNTPYRSAWNYRDQTFASIATSYRLIGASGTVYHTGGYTTTLGPKRLQTEHTLSELRAYHWQDHRTRVFFLELTMYNVNLNMFSHVTLIVEYLVSDAVMLSAHVMSVNGNEAAGFRGLLYVVLFVFYVFRIAYLVNRHGLFHNLCIVSNALRIIVVSLALSCMVCYLVHYFTSKRFIEKFHGEEEVTYFDFDSFTLVFRMLQIEFSVLLCFALTMFFTLVRGGRTFFSQLYTFTISWPWICWLTLMVLLFYILLSRGYLLLNIVMLNGVSLDIFHPKAVDTRAPEDLELLMVQLFLIIKTIIFFIFFSMFMITFLHYSMVAKGFKVIRSHKLNFITFICERLLRKKETRGGKLVTL